MKLWTTLLLAGAPLIGLGAFGLLLAQRAPTASQPVAAAPAPLSERTPAPPPPEPPWPAEVRTLIIGGGPLPDTSEVSLEQNVRLAASVLPAPSVALFGGGPGTLSVRVDDAPPEATLALRLGELFAPRPSRKSRFRASELAAHRADLTSIRQAFERALAEPTAAPLTVYIAAHGEQADHAADNAVLVWGNDALTARDIAELHDGRGRPLLLIVTSCFSGGFGELSFRAADDAKGPAPAPRCGLFAGPWDRETSGCDPDPNRAAQESYSLHFLNALAQRDRNGAPLPLARVDFDRDGRVSPLEAHAYARIWAESIDMPTTTSERYLRHVQARAAEGRRASELLPEDAAVARALGDALELADGSAVQRELAALESARHQRAERVQAAEDALEDAYWPLVTRLLERFPVLDDPYHPAFAATLRDHEAAIDALLASSPEAIAHGQATRALADADADALEVELRQTKVQRLHRALETLELAAALERRGGAELAHYRALLACERTPLSGGSTRAPAPRAGAAQDMP